MPDDLKTRILKPGITADQKRWIIATLTNDETSTDAELVEYFITEGGVERFIAEFWVAKRNEYIGVI